VYYCFVFKKLSITLHHNQTQNAKVMKTTSAIQKLNKAGIEVNIVRTNKAGSFYEGKLNGNVILFTDFDGEAKSLYVVREGRDNGYNGYNGIFASSIKQAIDLCQD